MPESLVSLFTKAHAQLNRCSSTPIAARVRLQNSDSSRVPPVTFTVDRDGILSVDGLAPCNGAGCPACLAAKACKYTGRWLAGDRALSAAGTIYARFLVLGTSARKEGPVRDALRELRTHLATFQKFWKKVQKRTGRRGYAWSIEVQIVRLEDGSQVLHPHLNIVFSSTAMKDVGEFEELWTDAGDARVDVLKGEADRRTVLGYIAKANYANCAEKQTRESISIFDARTARELNLYAEFVDAIYKEPMETEVEGGQKVRRSRRSGAFFGNGGAYGGRSEPKGEVSLSRKGEVIWTLGADASPKDIETRLRQQHTLSPKAAANLAVRLRTAGRVYGLAAQRAERQVREAIAAMRAIETRPRAAASRRALRALAERTERSSLRAAALRTKETEERQRLRQAFLDAAGPAARRPEDCVERGGRTVTLLPSQAYAALADAGAL